MSRKCCNRQENMGNDSQTPLNWRALNNLAGHRCDGNHHFSLRHTPIQNTRHVYKHQWSLRYPSASILALRLLYYKNAPTVSRKILPSNEQWWRPNNNAAHKLESVHCLPPKRDYEAGIDHWNNSTTNNKQVLACNSVLPTSVFEHSSWANTTRRWQSPLL